MRRLVVLALAVLSVVAACSSDSSSSSTAATTDETVAAATAPAESLVTAPPDVDTAPAVTSPAVVTTAAAAAGWRQVMASGECMCADGSPYSYWIREADPTKVVFFLQGGGACFDATTCKFDSGSYKTTTGRGDDPNNFSTGVWDFSDKRNPLADYSFVFAPYCTGDVHLGNATHEYGPQLTVQHKGSVNATTALNDLATQFPDAEQVVVTGESAGSVPTPLYAGLAHDLLPNAEITVLADGSGAYPDVPAINAVIGAAWGTGSAIPPWPENAGLTAATWSFPGLFIQAHKHDSDIIFGRHDYAFDRVQQLFAGLAGIAADDLVTLIDKNETQIEAGGVDLRSYISPGDSHTVLSRPEFYTETVEGIPLVDWVSDLVRRQPDLDVHCTDCKAPG
ncbi:MAG: pectin acetylesterase-family hydrolase [Ilumatobacteraceae bacterium]